MGSEEQAVMYSHSLAHDEPLEVMNEWPEAGMIARVGLGNEEPERDPPDHQKHQTQEWYHQTRVLSLQQA
jgi:hypothetical protein